MMPEEARDVFDALKRHKKSADETNMSVVIFTTAELCILTTMLGALLRKRARVRV